MQTQFFCMVWFICSICQVMPVMSILAFGNGGQRFIVVNNNSKVFGTLNSKNAYKTGKTRIL